MSAKTIFLGPSHKQAVLIFTFSTLLVKPVCFLTLAVLEIEASYFTN